MGVQVHTLQAKTISLQSRPLDRCDAFKFGGDFRGCHMKLTYFAPAVVAVSVETAAV